MFTSKLPCLALVALFLLVAVVPNQAAPEKKDAKKEAVKTAKNAAGLLSDMEKSIAFILKSAKAAKLDPRQKKQIPFFSGLKAVSASVEAMKKSSAAKDPGFFGSS